MTEADVEQVTIEWFQKLGYGYRNGIDIAPDGATPERTTYCDVVLASRLRAALTRINPHLDHTTLEGVARRGVATVSETDKFQILQQTR